jgi:WD40 repeat protein
MHNLSRLLVAFLTVFVGVTACAPTPTSSLPESESTVLQPATAGPASYETSLPAIQWGEKNHEHRLFLLVPSTGEALTDVESIPLGRSFSYAYSPDRRRLAVMTFPDDSNANGSLMLIDLLAWKSERFDLKLYGWVGAMAFSPDARLLAISHGGDSMSKLTVFDIMDGTILAQGQTDLLMPRLKFTSGSDALMLYGLSKKGRFTENSLGGGTPQVLLLDAADLSPRWQAELAGVREGVFPKDENTELSAYEMVAQGQAMFLGPGVVFAPDRDGLYIVHADSDQLTSVDFAAYTVETVTIQPGLSWLETLLSLTASVAHAKVADGTSKDVAISPDGKLLYVVGTHNSSVPDQQGNLQIDQIPLGLEIIRIENGSGVTHIETGSGDLSLSPDGRFLYLRTWGMDENSGPGTEVLDTSSRAIVTHAAGIYPSVAFQVNGEPLLVSTYSLSETEPWHQMTILQPDDLRVLAEWKGPEYITWLTIE